MGDLLPAHRQVPKRARGVRNLPQTQIVVIHPAIAHSLCRVNLSLVTGQMMGAFLQKGDALVPADVSRIFGSLDECDVVVSTVGATPADPRADSEGNIALIDAAAKKKVKKFVLVTSIGCGNSSGAPPPQVYDVLRPVLLEKDKAEAHLMAVAKQTGMAAVIVRPGGLKTAPATGTGVLTEDTTVCGAIHRADVASLVVKATLSDKANGKVLSAVDKAQLFNAPAMKVFEC